MSSTATSNRTPINAYILQGVGSWAEGKVKAMGHSNKDKDPSRKSQFNIGNVSNFNDHRTSQESRSLEKQGERAAATVPSSRHRNSKVPRFDQDVPDTSTCGLAPTGRRTYTNIASVQLHRYLSTAARDDTWHSMRNAPIQAPTITAEGMQMPARGSSPSSLRAEHDSDTDEQEEDTDIANHAGVEWQCHGILDTRQNLWALSRPFHFPYQWDFDMVPNVASIPKHLPKSSF